MREIIPYGKHTITEDDIQEVLKVLRSDFLTQGPTVKKFEVAFAKYVGSKFAIAVSNGTAALHLCAMALNVSKDDKVITTPITFAASANCIRYCDGEVIFSDINEDDYLLDLGKLKRLLQNSPKGTYKGIIPVDLAGKPYDLEKLRLLADEYDLWIIEDACHAPGGFFVDSKQQNQKCGNSHYADLAIFSFHPVKHIAAGEGGMVTTNDEKLYKRLLNLRTHGIQQDKEKNIATYGMLYYEMQELGYNYRLNDIQSALGLSQLSRAESGLRRRREIAKCYNSIFQNRDYIINHSGWVEGHAYHLYIIEVENRDKLVTYLRENNILAQIHYFPLHLMPYYQSLGGAKGDFPCAEKYYSRALSLPIFPTLSDTQVKMVLEVIDAFYNFQNQEQLI